MAIRYKIRCLRCRKNYVLVGRGQRYALCYDCQKDELNKPVKDPKMKKMFNIPEEFYKKNAFLRDIKINFLKYGQLTDKQIDAFKKSVKQMKEG